MRGFEKLQELKDNMMKPIYEKRRHLGCELCGTTFYGYYKNTGTNAVPNGEESPHPKREGWIRVHTYDDVFILIVLIVGFQLLCEMQKPQNSSLKGSKKKAEKKKNAEKSVKQKKMLNLSTWITSYDLKTDKHITSGLFI